MKLLVTPSRLSGTIAVSGSKSHTIRGVVFALAAEGRSVLRAPLRSADTLAVLAAAREFGARIEEHPDRWEITGSGGRLADPGRPVDLCNSGTGLRLLTGLAALQDFQIEFDGDASLRTRKMGSLLAALEMLGAEYTAASGGVAPLSIRGPVHGGKTRVDGRLSQFLSSLLIALPLLREDSVVELDELFEQPYVGITLAWLEALGIDCRASEDWLRWEIPGNQHYAPFDRTIPADFSTAAFPLVAAALSGDGVTICNLDFDDAQGDKAVFGMVEAMGGVIRRSGELRVERSPRLRGGEFDLNATPDALPILAVAGAFASGETRLVNVPQARCKETDRIAVMASELGKMGVVVTELPDGLVIQGGRPHGSAELSSHDDHRIGMALAVAALAADGPSEIDAIEAAAVTYPNFVADFQRLGAGFTCRN